MPALEPEIPTPPKQAVALVTGSSAFAWNAIVSCQNECISAVWKNPHCTPQEAFDEMGTKAAKACDDHARLTELMIAQNVADGRDPMHKVMLPGNAFTRELDGRVTVGSGPYAP